MNILCVIDSLNQGGAQRQLIGLALGFKEKGHDVSFLTYHDIPFFNHLLDNSGIKITCIVEPRYLIRILKMRVFIREGKYDAVLSFLEASGFICEIVGFPIRKWKIIVAARDHPYKNLHGLIEALSDLSISEREAVKIEWYGIDKMDQIQKEYSKINEYHLELSLIHISEPTRLGMISYA